MIVGPESPANRSPPFGETVGDGLGEPVGDGLGELVGPGLGLEHGEGLGDGLGLPFGETVGVGLAVLKMPATTTVLPFNTCTGMPAVITGTG